MTDTQAVRLVSDRLADIAREDPQRELVFDPVFGRLSYADVDAQVRRLAHGLVARGIGPGDVVILQLPNWAPFLTFHIALTAIGAITALVPFVYREHEISGVAALTGACALVVPDEYRGFSYRRMAERVRATHTRLRHVFLVDPGSNAALPRRMRRRRCIRRLRRLHGRALGAHRAVRPGRPRSGLRRT